MADILLENKLGLARGCGIETECSLILPYPCPIGDMDLCIILSNALDNAVNYCRKMEAEVREGCFILRVLLGMAPLE